MFGGVKAPLKGMFPFDGLKRLETFLCNIILPYVKHLGIEILLTQV
jgi:hypothetical protein